MQIGGLTHGSGNGFGHPLQLAVAERHTDIGERVLILRFDKDPKKSFEIRQRFGREASDMTLARAEEFDYLLDERHDGQLLGK
jgi:hypothetical protein